MWSDETLSAIWALAWLLLTIVGFIYARALADIWYTRARGRWLGKTLLVVLLIALVVRLVPSLLLPVGAGYDIESFRLTGEAFLAGEDVYTSAAMGRHPYLPMQVYLIGLASYGAELTSLPFVFLIKLPAVIADVIITAVIYSTGKRSGLSREVTLNWALLYALNPISIMVTAYHGQFDSVTVMLLLFAWFFWHFGQRLLVSATALGFAILNKTWPVVFLPIILLRITTYRKRIIYTTLSVLIPVTFTIGYIVIFDADSRTMLNRALTHTGVPGYWGLSAMLAVAGDTWDTLQDAYDGLTAIRRWLILAAGLYALWRTKKQSSLEALVTVILCVFAVTVGMGLQWLLWVVPFAILANDIRWLKRYCLVGTLFLVFQLFGYHMVPWASHLFSPVTVNTLLRLVSIPIWLVMAWWAIDRLKRARVLPGTLTS
ncbi:MAG: glycosyltransferase 87 family protein [Candidatus Promineifilaceae bacterium]